MTVSCCVYVGSQATGVIRCFPQPVFLCTPSSTASALLSAVMLLTAPYHPLTTLKVFSMMTKSLLRKRGIAWQTVQWKTKTTVPKGQHEETHTNKQTHCVRLLNKVFHQRFQQVFWLYEVMTVGSVGWCWTPCFSIFPWHHLIGFLIW